MNLIPNEYPRRILLAVTGLSPQVLTETLYALAVANPTPYKPTEIHLLTTSVGKDLAKIALLHDDGGQFHALLKDYPEIGQPIFNEDFIHVIHDKDASLLADIRTPEENALAADAITEIVARLTADGNASLHVSIAGGRKTMGFYLGYAFSLFARPQDRLSHVLVSSPFEGHPEFFYPPKRTRRLTTRDNKYIDTADAVVTLAEIPVVRLRHGLPNALLEKSLSFNQAVEAIQNGFAPPLMQIDLIEQTLKCGGIKVILQPLLFAWMAWWAINVHKNKSMLHWRDIEFSSFLKIYGAIVDKHSEAYGKLEQRLREDGCEQFYQENNAKLNKQLTKQLSISADPYLLKHTGKRPFTKRGLMLTKDQIQIVGL